MTEVNEYVQTCLKDHGISPWRRARMAASQIEDVVLAEEGLPKGTPLGVPLEWEHRVPADLSRRWVPVATAPDDLPIIEGEVTYGPERTALMIEAFNALDNGDEESAKKKIDEFYGWEDPA